MARSCKAKAGASVAAAAVAILLATGLSGCSQSSNVASADAEHHWGGTDPLVQKMQPGSGLNKQLNERFKLVQAAK